MSNENVPNTYSQNDHVLNLLSMIKSDMNRRFDNVENTIAIIAVDHKEFSKNMVEIKVKHEGLQKDVTAIANISRDKELGCQLKNNTEHEKIYTKIESLEKEIETSNTTEHKEMSIKIESMQKDMTLWKGGIIAFNIILGIIFSILQLKK